MENENARERTGESARIASLERELARQKGLFALSQHRIRNLFSMLLSISNQLSRSSKGVDAFRSRFDDRLMTISRLQSMLAASTDGGVGLAGLLETEAAALAGNCPGDLTFGGPTVRLPGRTAQSVALALHELLINAKAHGALAQEGGTVLVRWVRNNAGLTIDWSETCPNGIGPEGKTGFGREIIEKALQYQFGASTLFTLDPTGLHYRITLPIEALEFSHEN